MSDNRRPRRRVPPTEQETIRVGGADPEPQPVPEEAEQQQPEPKKRQGKEPAKGRAAADNSEAAEVEENVGEIVGENQPTEVGRENPTNSQAPGPSIFGGDRKAKLHGRKLHPRQESDQKNITMRLFLLNAVVDLADREGLSTQPGKVFDALVEHALRQLAPDLLKGSYEDRCQDIGMPSDWK